MSDTGDLKSHALNSSHDFYDLLDIQEGARENEIRRAYRKTALKYHPDKVGGDVEKLEKFHLLQIAYDVLSDPAVKELYDNARRARFAKAERDQLFEGRRKAMKEDLERRENGAAVKRKRENEAEVEFERELARLAEDGKRRRKEREEMLRREAEEIEREERREKEGEAPASTTPRSNGQTTASTADVDRSVTLKFPVTEETQHIDEAEIKARFERFGKVEHVVLREKKIKVDGEKHRQLYKTAILLFQSAVGAHATVSDFPRISHREPETYNCFQALGWAGGKEPDFIPKPTGTQVEAPPRRREPDAPLAVSPATNGHGQKPPSFGSFKTATKVQDGGPSLDEITMIRLKNAERRRMEEKIRREEAATQANAEDAA